jgi:hypothetical protein
MMHGLPDRQALTRCSSLTRMLQGMRVFFLVRPAGRTYLEVKVLYSPDKGKS